MLNQPFEFVLNVTNNFQCSHYQKEQLYVNELSVSIEKFYKPVLHVHRNFYIFTKTPSAYTSLYTG